MDEQVFVFTSALGAALDASGWVCLILESTDGALRPSAEFAGFTASTTDLVENPSEQNPREKDEEGRKNQPRQGQANHGAIGEGWLEANWYSTKPQASGVCSAGAKRRD
jgi:hypothetical protein